VDAGWRLKDGRQPGAQLMRHAAGSAGDAEPAAVVHPAEDEQLRRFQAGLPQMMGTRSRETQR
jgi:hypothetical protein